MANPPCSGIIVIDDNKTVLVCTKQDNYSFPKGKKKKGETILETAWRELTEETGLTQEHVKLIDDFALDENSDRGNIATKYYVGLLIKNLEKLQFDPDELVKVEWIDIQDAYKLDKFKNRRKELLEVAHAKSIK